MNWICKTFDELTKQELYDIMVLRQIIFVVEQDCPYLDADGKDLKAWHLMGIDESGALIAYTRLLDKGVSYENEVAIGRVVVAEKGRGKGIGRDLMEVSIDKVNALFGSRRNRIGAQCYLTKFYESLGYKIDSEEYLEDGIPHVEMQLE